MARVVMRHMSFVAHRTFFWTVRSLIEKREETRDEAEAFINMIGVDNVVSVVEHSMVGAPFAVVVWYRVEEGQPSESVEPAVPPHSASSGVRTPKGGTGG